MTEPWLGLCRAAVGDVRGVLAELPTRAEREPVVGAGEGGDDTTAIDAAAERVILARFDRDDTRIVSEEIGVRGNGRWTIVVDPIDGSLNAKRGIPFFSLSVAVADGETMDDVVFGYVYDFGSGEEWTATRGGGARLNGAPLTEKPKDTIEILSFEATTLEYVTETSEPSIVTSRTMSSSVTGRRSSGSITRPSAARISSCVGTVRGYPFSRAAQP